MIATIRRLIASLLVLCLAMPMPSQAAMVGTDSALGAAQRDRVNSLLDRADVQARLESYGVKAGDVKARVAALTDDEVSQLAAKIDSLPAGGDSILGILVLIFIVLLITDILGLTKIFPFTRPIR
ncbi:MAG TPA: PA2779 family protein [Burkholderiales bacterium]|nr:PA2779 family protein [Burkholderiales bacterium]